MIVIISEQMELLGLCDCVLVLRGSCVAGEVPGIGMAGRASKEREEDFMRITAGPQEGAP